LSNRSKKPLRKDRRILPADFRHGAAGIDAKIRGTATRKAANTSDWFVLPALGG
jgi:hypothetical protein